MAYNVKLAQDTISSSELTDLCSWIQQGAQLTKGPLTRQLEQQFSDYTGCKYSVFVNSGSSANLVMAYALSEIGYLKNKKVIVPAISWITTLAPFLQFGYEVILCDSDPDDLGLDLNHFEKLCKEHQPSLAILVHVLGHVNKMDELNAICERYGVTLIEDACEALGSEYKGKKTGNLSLAGSFSFYYGHHISTIEGGMVTTNDRNLYNVMLSIRSHGWGRDIEPQFHEEWRKNVDVDEFRDFYTFYYAGFNLRSTDLNAFLGIGQLKLMDQIAKTRAANFDFYNKYIDSKFWRQKSDTSLLSSFAFGTFVENRLEVSKVLKEHTIESRPLICGSMGRQPFWVKKFGVTPLALADKVHDYGIYLPNHLHMGEKEIQYVAEIFNKVAKPI